MDDPKTYLTPRELQVWKLCVAGKTEPQIAVKLLMSPKTVSVHKVKIANKRRTRGLPLLREVLKGNQ
jgi:DNA-binding CsgD family transcriptional regulator